MLRKIMIRSFEDIECWKKARVLNKLIYSKTTNKLFSKDFDLTRQIRRATVSISSNIAEGFERQSDKEFAHFLNIAKASAGEVRSQLYLALDLKYLSEVEFNELKTKTLEVSKMISGFIKYLKK